MWAWIKRAEIGKSKLRKTSGTSCAQKKNANDNRERSTGCENGYIEIWNYTPQRNNTSNAFHRLRTPHIRNGYGPMRLHSRGMLGQILPYFNFQSMCRVMKRPNLNETLKPNRLCPVHDRATSGFLLAARLKFMTVHGKCFFQGFVAYLAHLAASPVNHFVLHSFNSSKNPPYVRTFAIATVGNGVNWAVLWNLNHMEHFVTHPLYKSLKQNKNLIQHWVHDAGLLASQNLPWKIFAAVIH